MMILLIKATFVHSITFMKTQKCKGPHTILFSSNISMEFFALSIEMKEPGGLS